jgi:chromosome segregation ATPase
MSSKTSFSFLPKFTVILVASLCAIIAVRAEFTIPTFSSWDEALDWFQRQQEKGESLNRRKENLERAKTRAEDAIRDLNVRLVNLHQEGMAVNSRASRLSIELTDAASQRPVLDATLTQAQARLAEVEANWEAIITPLQNDYDGWTNYAEELLTHAEDLESRARELEESQQWDSGYGEYQYEIDSLRQEAERVRLDRTNVINAATDVFEDLIDATQRLGAELADAEQSVNTAESDIVTNEALISELDEEVELADSLLEDIQADMDDLENTIDANQAALDAAISGLEYLEPELEDNRSAYDFFQLWCAEYPDRAAWDAAHPPGG